LTRYVLAWRIFETCFRIKSYVLTMLIRGKIDSISLRKKGDEA
jgi:hypothetical protein